MKQIVLFISFVLLGTLSYAQFNVGPVIGVSGSQVEGDGYGGYDKPGAIVGGFANTNLNDKWSIQFDIYYIGKGSRKVARPDKGDYDYFLLNLNYAEIPIAIRYRYKSFLFETGPYYSQLFGIHMEDENRIITELDDSFKSYDLGGLVGAYYQINDHLYFNIRSKASILPIRDFNNFDQNIGIMNKLFNRGWYNLDINMSLRYQFNTSKNKGNE